MRLRSQPRYYLKGAALCVCLIIAALFVVSLKYEVRWTSGGQAHTFVVEGGAVMHITHHWLSDGFPPPRHPWAKLDPPGWTIHPHNRGVYPHLLVPGVGKSGVGRTGCSLVIPLACLAVPMMLARFVRRKYPHGHCHQCGYDLRGNESGRCSECGAPIRQEETVS